jgi:hypothetical protein
MEAIIPMNQRPAMQHYIFKLDDSNGAAEMYSVN